MYKSFCVIKKHRQIGNHVKCFCGIQKTDLQFNENSQGNLKQEEFLYLQLLVHSYEIYYVWQNVLYCIFMLYKVVVHFTQRSFSLLFCKQKANWRRNVCNKTIPFIYICYFYCLRKFLLSWFHDCECQKSYHIESLNWCERQQGKKNINIWCKHKIRVLVQGMNVQIKETISFWYSSSGCICLLPLLS